ncbi:hypothetical protein V5O48_018190, partial [Marasmius crinis-equi]
MSHPEPPPPTDTFAKTHYAQRAQQLIEMNRKIELLGEANFELNLPKIAVIGAQSSGKSSLVEAISKITVPREDSICTRCPMECTVMVAPTWSCNIYLRKKYEPNGQPVNYNSKIDFETGITDPSGLELWLRRAQAAILCPHRDPSEFRGMSAEAIKMLLKDDEKALSFSKNVVGVDVKGPGATPLTFVDLPGIVYNIKDSAYIQLVKDLVNSSIAGSNGSNTVILVVVPMTGDMEGQEAMRLAREQDPEGVRTVAVLTKPDLVGPGEIGKQKRWKSTIDGETDQLKHGYYCVRLPDDEDRKLDSRTFQRKAESFFASEPPWNEVVNRDRFGVQNLVSSLSRLLVGLIESNLPKMRKQIESLLQKHRSEMSSLPPSPTDSPSIRMRRLTHQYLRAVESVIKGESHRQVFVQKNRAAFATFRDELWSSGIEFVPYINQPAPYGAQWTQLNQWDESFSSSAVPQWERASVGVGGAGAGGLPAFRHRLELKDVRDVINESIGWELPDFVPFQATVNLVQLSLDDWPAPTQSCLSSVFENSWNVFEEIIQEVFQHHPRLLSLVRLLTFESYKACYDRTSEALLETLREEPDLLYTQRCHYLSTEKQLWAERFGAACGSAKADWTKEVELMAGRFVDVIPRQIEHKLNRAFAGNISERIRADVDDLPSDKAEGLMEEDKKIARKRAKLRDVVERLEQAEKLVMSFKGGGGGGGYDDSEEEEDSDVDLR